MAQKNSRYLVLMISSVLVMLVLQVFWLNTVYQDYKNSLKQETFLLFSTTVTNMIDSLVWKGASPIDLPFIHNLDSLRSGLNHGIVLKRFDSQTNGNNTNEKLRIQVSVDSLSSGKTDSSLNRMIRVISTGGNLETDSIKRVLRPIITGLDSLPGQGFEFNFRREILDTVLMKETFNQKLHEQGYHLKAGVRKLKFGDKAISNTKSRLVLDEINIPFGTRIQPYLDGYQIYLWKKMTAPILFGFLVLALVSISFVIMYRTILKQQRLNLLKNDLISNITHELKTPVATVGVVLEALENFGADQQTEIRQEYIQIAKKELKRLSKMSDSILSSAVSGNQKELKSQLAFDQLLEEQIQSFKPILNSNGFAFDYQKEEGDYTILGHQEQLALMIFNLLDNAVKYSGDKKAINIKLYHQANKLYFNIQDQGIGIPEKFQKHIFEKFVRVPQQDLHDVKGYGMGLAQVYAAVQNHQGKITIKSELGKGTLFTIQLPKND
ncbi:sensor histidine kinase [Belliella marina]|uniref:histidine kinase n=1 Tax=Belliella marina TaxID=1644146 RepID=A0ABW4VQB4_9BACT